MEPVGTLGQIPRWAPSAETEKGEEAMCPMSYPDLGRGTQTLVRFVVMWAPGLCCSISLFPLGMGGRAPRVVGVRKDPVLGSRGQGTAAYGYLMELGRVPNVGDPIEISRHFCP